jgi:hypothetical protein
MPIGQPVKTPILQEVKGEEFAAEVHPFFIKAMLCGATGSGKTQSAITLPKSREKPLLLIDYDGRWETVRDEVEEGTVKLVELFDENMDSPKAWNKAEELRKELWAQAREEGGLRYSGIIEDSLTSMGRLAMNLALTLDPKTGLGGAPAKQHYSPQITFLVKHINSMRNLPCHYILTSHFDLEKDEDDGAIKILPKVTKSLRTEIPSWFNEVYMCSREVGETEGIRYQWNTAGTGKLEFFKSTMNNKQAYWNDPVIINFKKQPVGFDMLVKIKEKIRAEGAKS